MPILVRLPFTYILDANGNPTRTTWPDGYYIERVFDQMDRMTGIKLNGAATNALTYSYDQLSRRSQIVMENGITTTYGFEIDNDLATLSHSFPGQHLVPSTLTYTYGTNAAGENTSKQVSNSQYLWHPQAAGTKTFGTASSVDTYSSINGVAQSYNNRGMLTSDGTTSFGYNVDGQAISAARAGVTESMKYDPLGRQVDKTVNSVSTRQYFAGDQKMAEYNSAGALQERYVYGAPGEIALKVSSAGAKTYYLKEGDGSVIATTDAAGAVLNKYSYSPMGESNNMTGTTFGYKGQVYDSNLGMYTRTDGLVYAPDKGRVNQPLSGSFLGDNKYGVTAPRASVANGVDNSNEDNGVNLNPTIESAGQFSFFSDNAIPPYIPPAPPTMRTGLAFDPKNRGGAGSDKKKTPFKVKSLIWDKHESKLSELSKPRSHLQNALGSLEMLPGGKLAAADKAVVSAVVKSLKASVLAPYRFLKGLGLSDAHHIIQWAAVKNHNVGSHGAQPSMHLTGPSWSPTSEHGIVTEYLRTTKLGGTYGQESQASYNALRTAGKTPEQAHAAISYADQYYMGKLGWTRDSITTVPGSRK